MVSHGRYVMLQSHPDVTTARIMVQPKLTAVLKKADESIQSLPKKSLRQVGDSRAQIRFHIVYSHCTCANKDVMVGLDLTLYHVGGCGGGGAVL